MKLALAVATAGLLEAVVGEPPTRVHPVAWFGSLVEPLDAEWRRPILVGALGALCLPLVAGAFGALVVLGALWVDPRLGFLSAGVVLFLATSLKQLLLVADSVVDESASAVDTARQSLLALAGRDASTLSPELIRSAAVESAAENLADGLVATLGAFVVVGTLAPLLGVPALPAAAAGAAWVKGVNTMDSMLGYHSKRVGTPAARLDDAVMWLPARASAVALAVAYLDLGAIARARDWLAAVPSPNSGWPMGVAAAGLDTRLTKPGVYTLNEAASLPDVQTARRGIRGVGVAGLLAYGLAGVVGWF